ncbi:hypothetical protein B0H13DRAFT_2231279 [Mycena leptocephala]|nr:hypothetical protein B0H13DRAFT_2231279 [Mycena leptocephala]
MPSILNLKFKGNKSFVAFSNLNDTESLTKTWKVCTKVASYLEQGQRLENLSWRLWHLQNLMVDTDNAKSKREFKKLSKCMGDKLDKEKGRSIEELPAPDFKRNPSTDLIRQRAVEKERTREASMHTPEHIIQRMQFTFAVDPPAPSSASASASSVSGPPLLPTPIITLPRRPSRPRLPNAAKNTTANANANGNTKRKRTSEDGVTVRLPTLFSTSFGPRALYPAPSLAPRMNYGEAHTHYADRDAGDKEKEGGGRRGRDDDMRIARPTIELPLDELLNAEADGEDMGGAVERAGAGGEHNMEWSSTTAPRPPTPLPTTTTTTTTLPTTRRRRPTPPPRPRATPLLRLRPLQRTPSPRPGAPRPPTTRTTTPSSSSSRPTTAGTTRPIRTSSSSVLRVLNANSAPGGVKAECSNCGATHTPLWRRGLNDELNCNACGLYCKLHKRPRPKTMRNAGAGGENRGQSVRAEAVDVMAQCYNCHTTATPLWRKDDEGKTVCNACGLYYKLHGSARPISMKSDVIRKRSRHDARRGGASASVSETPTASPGVSRRASPAPGGPASSASNSAGRASPTLAPDGTTTHSYDSASELSSALGPKPSYSHPYAYHDQYPDALPFASVDVGSELDTTAAQRANKRRRMSVDSASEPPSSAVSYGSYADGYTSASSQFSMEFPFSRFPNVSYNDGGAHGNGNNGNGHKNGNGNGNGNGGGLRGVGGGNAFWHPPMMMQGEGPNVNNSPGGFLHPPMLPTSEEPPMDYLHPPMVVHNYHQQQDEESMNNFFGGFMQGGGLHPPMLPGDEGQMMGMGMLGGAHPPMMPYEDVYDSNGNMRY